MGGEYPRPFPNRVGIDKVSNCGDQLLYQVDGDSLSVRHGVALGKDWSDMDSVEPYLTRSRLSTDKRNRVGLTRISDRLPTEVVKPVPIGLV
ncbi:hypothetical protein CR513_56895, partial [Mucuna pruriens]